MRISDWSSDVCSSDLQIGAVDQRGIAPVEGHQIGLALVAEAGQVAQSRVELVPGGDAAGVERLQEAGLAPLQDARSEEHTSELQSLMRISYAVFCLKKKKTNRPRVKTHGI